MDGIKALSGTLAEHRKQREREAQLRHERKLKEAIAYLRRQGYFVSEGAIN